MIRSYTFDVKADDKVLATFTTAVEAAWYALALNVSGVLADVQPVEVVQ